MYWMGSGGIDDKYFSSDFLSFCYSCYWLPSLSVAFAKVFALFPLFTLLFNFGCDTVPNSLKPCILWFVITIYYIHNVTARQLGTKTQPKLITNAHVAIKDYLGECHNQPSGSPLTLSQPKIARDSVTTKVDYHYCVTTKNCQGQCHNHSGSPLTCHNQILSWATSQPKWISSNPVTTKDHECHNQSGYPIPTSQPRFTMDSVTTKVDIQWPYHNQNSGHLVFN
jgi:hypothetical protein